jgi:hypothetical protein
MSSRKLLGWLGISAFLWLATPALSWAQFGSATCGVSFGTPCAAPCQSFHCPPAYKHCYEGAPHLHFHRGCPHPICNPCDLPQWGYFETCWTPWPFPPSFAHCPVPPPAQFMPLNAYGSQLPPVRSTPPGAGPQAPPTPMFPSGSGQEELIPLPQPRTNGGMR